MDDKSKIERGDELKQTTKERQADKIAQESAKQTSYENMLKVPPPKTWSAQMPAYAGTELCPDKQLRGRGEWVGKRDSDSVCGDDGRNKGHPKTD